jgi:alkyldihydroxyacetonephosphate synthase
MSEDQKLKWYGWGLADKEFDLNRRNNFWPYLNDKLRMEGLEGEICSLPVDITDIALPEPGPPGLVEHFESMLGAANVRSDATARITHAAGKSYYDLIRVRRGLIEHPPDVVLYPENETQIFNILRLAAEARIAVIPFGGGTSVVGGVEALKDEGQIAAISLDLSRLNRLINIDEISLIATIEAGLKGPALEKLLQARGYTLGHYPQSFEFSTLGGWIATRSAGQQSNKYGRIEHMVASVTVATPEDLITTLDAPASAAGPSLKELLIGSEGQYGVITKAKMRVQKLPAARKYTGIVFKDFFFGSQAIRTMMQNGIQPATARLSDEAETEAIMKMRAESESMFESALAQAGKWYLKNKGYINSTCLMILGFEDTAERVNQDMKAAIEICKQHDGYDLGARIGDHWYKDRFELPYLRDLLLDRGVMIDTLETATSWSNLLEAYNGVKEALVDSINGFNIKSHPLVFCHISHSYVDGASLYFTFLARQTRDAEIEQWRTAKAAASEAILACGATISHHHGVGRDHAVWARRELGKLGSHALDVVKRVLDPAGILNPGKLLR